MGENMREHWAVEVGCKIVDALPAGKLTTQERDYLNGLIAGALVRVANEGPLDPSDVKLPRLKRLSDG